MRKKMEEMSKELGRLQAIHMQRQTIPSAPQPQAPLVFNNSGMQPSNNTTTLPPRASGFRCFNCGTSGHTVRFCPQPKRQEAQQNGNSSAGIIGATKGTKLPDENKPERKTYLRLYVAGSLRKVLLDTGSDATLLPSFAVPESQVQKSTHRLLAANGTSIGVCGKATVDAHMGQHSFQITGLVTDHVAEIMLGIDFLRDHEAVWDFKNGEIQLDDFVHQLHSKPHSKWRRRVILQSDYTVPARFEVGLPTKVVYNVLRMNNTGSQKQML